MLIQFSKKFIFLCVISVIFSACLAIGVSQEATPAASSFVTTTVSVAPTVAPMVTTTSPTAVTNNTSAVTSTSASNVVTPHCDTMQMPANSETKSTHRSYSSVRVDGPYIAMTFDDGPSATLTPRLLDILKERNIKATFFVIGENAERHPEILAREVAEGHEIGDHSWSHPQLTKISEERLKKEVGDTSDVIFKATGKRPLYLRPPYGAMNPHVKHFVEDQYGMKIIFWSVDPLDWKRPGSAIVSQRILAGAKPGAIILSHDIHPGTIDAMPATLDALLAKGYHFVTVSELIALESATPTPAATAAPEVKAKKKKKSS